MYYKPVRILRPHCSNSFHWHNQASSSKASYSFCASGAKESGNTSRKRSGFTACRQDDMHKNSTTKQHRHRLTDTGGQTEIKTAAFSQPLSTLNRQTLNKSFVTAMFPAMPAPTVHRSRPLPLFFLNSSLAGASLIPMAFESYTFSPTMQATSSGDNHNHYPLPRFPRNPPPASTAFTIPLRGIFTGILCQCIYHKQCKGFVCLHPDIRRLPNDCPSRMRFPFELKVHSPSNVSTLRLFPFHLYPKGKNIIVASLMVINSADIPAFLPLNPFR